MGIMLLHPSLRFRVTSLGTPTRPYGRLVRETPDPYPATTVPDVFAAAVTRQDPARPLLTWYDDATGDRAELSGATLGNWVAKTANLLVDGCGLGRGDLAVVDTPPHWQTAAVLLGCWSAGLRTADATEEPPDVVFAAAPRASRHAGSGAEVYGLALAPLAASLSDPPPGVSDFVIEVRAHGDHFHPPVPVRPDDAATPERSQAQLCRAAAQRAGSLGIAAGARVLLDAATHPDPLDWLLAPLAVGASVVLCANVDAAGLPERVGTERVTLALT
jgi:uncharacterized protein (TIGR03089 family)